MTFFECLAFFLKCKALSFKKRDQIVLFFSFCVGARGKEGDKPLLTYFTEILHKFIFTNSIDRKKIGGKEEGRQKTKFKNFPLAGEAR